MSPSLNLLQDSHYLCLCIFYCFFPLFFPSTHRSQIYTLDYLYAQCVTKLCGCDQYQLSLFGNKDLALKQF